METYRVTVYLSLFGGNPLTHKEPLVRVTRWLFSEANSRATFEAMDNWGHQLAVMSLGRHPLRSYSYFYSEKTYFVLLNPTTTAAAAAAAAAAATTTTTTTTITTRIQDWWPSEVDTAAFYSLLNLAFPS